jgi:hypothetical protein
MGAKFQLGGLQELLITYRDLLANNTVKSKKNKKLQVVDAKVITKAVDALNDASKALSEVCQQGVLAIEIE